MIYDVLIIGAGPAGIYSGLILQKGTPVQNISENFNIKILEAGKFPGGLTKFAFIQISKQWAFSGKDLILSLYKESIEAGITYSFEEYVVEVSIDDSIFLVKSNKKSYKAKFVIIATGIMTFPDVLLNPDKTNVGLHTPEEMAKEFITEYNWKNVLIVGNHLNSVIKLSDKLKKYFEKVNYHIIPENISISEKNFGIPVNSNNNYDGIIFDYNSYKLKNGTTYFLKNLNLDTINGYILTDSFGQTKIKGLYAVGTVTTPTSGVPAAIYSAQITAFDIGRQLKKTTKADSSGRFPYFPREFFWKESWQYKLKVNDKDKS